LMVVVFLGVTAGAAAAGARDFSSFSMPLVKIPKFQIGREAPPPKRERKPGRGFAKTPKQRIPICGGSYYKHLPSKYTNCSYKGELCHPRMHDRCECYHVCQRCGAGLR
jgi:hypothetical protein